ncbi:MAG: hypothetical protein DBX36_03750 [Oscillospiraceae bacterium]|nr:MAG: hypothetical protein DBX36_03750 [Oscillospiraceae bacterium]
MSLAIDIILAVIIILPVILGIKRGFVKTVMGLVSVLIAICASYILTPYLSPLCRNKIVEPYMRTPVESQIESMLDASGETFDTESLENLSEIPDVVKNICDTFGIDIQDIKSNEEIDKQSPDQSISDHITELILSRTAYIIAFISVFIAAAIVLRIITIILCAICKMPILNSINRIAGAVFGFCFGGISAFVIAKLLILLLPTLVSVNPELFGGAAEQSVLLKLIGNLFN